MKDLVTASDAESEKAQRFSPWYLQKVKGISALRVGLSWVYVLSNLDINLTNNNLSARLQPIQNFQTTWKLLE